MVDRSLNESLDMHIARNKNCISVTEKKESFYAGFLAFFKKIKDYFFPPDEFEEATFSHDAATIVHKVDKGFRAHLRKIKNLFKATDKK